MVCALPAYNIVSLGVYDGSMDYVGDVLLVEDGYIRGVNRRASYARDVVIEGYVLPSFVDAHLHLTWIGLLKNGVDLSNARSPKDVARQLARAQGPLAYGRGWDQESFTDRGTLPTRRILDQYIDDRPAVAVRVCGHLAVVNTRALEMTRVHEKYPGLVDRERGIVYEDAVEHVVNQLLNLVDVVDLVKTGLEEAYSHGIGGVSSMSCPLSEAKALKALEDRGDTPPVRVACYPRTRDLADSIAVIKGSSQAAVAGVKEFADGSLGARTAYLSRDYSDDPGNRGIRLLTSREIVDIGRRVLERGLRIAVHAIGDAALDEVIEAYSELQPGASGRVEHASIARRSQISELARLGVHVVVQPHFRVSDWWIEDRIGGDRMEWAYPFKTMARAGVNLALSTDAPIEPIDPLATIKAAMSECKQRACRPEEALSQRDSIRYYTTGSAQASGGPAAMLGKIEAGAPASLIWTSTDPASSRISRVYWVRVPPTA
ncbi:MAG: amidohydrolase [Desulfurococcales archaeon]|nr:amidohydrolase [Desulfurococcales archaeon]